MAPFCSMLVACKLENGIALVEQTPATTENILRIRLPKKYLANSATYRARFLSPIDGANHNARNCSPFAIPIPEATVDQSPASGGVGNRADDFHPQRATGVGGISRPSAFALGCQSALYSRTARSSDVQAIEHRQTHRLLLAGFAFDFARKITTPLSADN